jgi:hypothetical protein
VLVTIFVPDDLSPGALSSPLEGYWGLVREDLGLDLYYLVITGSLSTGNDGILHPPRGPDPSWATCPPFASAGGPVPLTLTLSAVAAAPSRRGEFPLL